MHNTESNCGHANRHDCAAERQRKSISFGQRCIGSDDCIAESDWRLCIWCILIPFSFEWMDVDNSKFSGRKHNDGVSPFGRSLIYLNRLLLWWRRCQVGGGSLHTHAQLTVAETYRFWFKVNEWKLTFCADAWIIGCTVYDLFYTSSNRNRVHFADWIPQLHINIHFCSVNVARLAPVRRVLLQYFIAAIRITFTLFGSTSITRHNRTNPMETMHLQNIRSAHHKSKDV